MLKPRLAPLVRPLTPTRVQTTASDSSAKVQHQSGAQWPDVKCTYITAKSLLALNPHTNANQDLSVYECVGCGLVDIFRWTLLPCDHHHAAVLSPAHSFRLTVIVYFGDFLIRGQMCRLALAQGKWGALN